LKLVIRMRLERKNGIFIYEGTSRLLEGFLHHLEGIDVRLVSNYRHFFDILPSKYGQGYGLSPGTPDRLLLTRHCGDVGPLPFEQIAFSDHEDLVSLGITSEECRDHMLSKFDNFSKMHENANPNPQGSDRIVSSHIIDLYEPMKNDFIGNKLLVQFFCFDIFPQSEHMCKVSRSGELEGKVEVRNNSRHSVAVQALVKHAFERELIHGHNSLYFSKILNAYDFSGFQKNCMSRDKLEKMFELSWDYELFYYPHRRENEENKVLLRESFEERVAAGAYCSIDIENALLMLKDDFKKWSD